MFWIVLLFVVYCWPTLYIYEHDNGRLVRIGRIDGDVTYLYDGRWEHPASKQDLESLRQKYGLDSLSDSVKK